MTTSTLSASPSSAISPTNPATGLSAAEADQRKVAGLGNTAGPSTGRTYGQIFRENFFTFINISLLLVGALLIAMGLVKEAVLASGLAVLNALLGILQEVIAKGRLDKIALLNSAMATVIRDGKELTILPADIVQGDILDVGPGDQFFVDGTLVTGSLKADESLLTGESDPIQKDPGSPVSSGSFCVSGQGRYLAVNVGDASIAAKIAEGARATKIALTPLQREVNQIIRLLLTIAAFFLTMIVLSSLLHDYPFKDTVLAAAVVLGIVPSGLFLMIVVTYSMATIRLAGQNALVQQVNAVESLSNVDVFCMDKTGTLTANALQLREVRPVSGSEVDARAMLGTLVRSTGGGTGTSDAIAEACPGQAVAPIDEIPFSSALKWSAASLTDGSVSGTFAIGAPEFLGRALGDPSLTPPSEWVDQGWRVLLFASSPETGSLHDASGNPTLPPSMRPTAWLAFIDQLRPNARETLQGFRDAGITIKIISGDNPETVAALARQAGMPHDAVLVSGLELEAMDDAAFAEAADTATIFGRVTPEQKRKLVNVLKERGAYVAMTGDGVNDVLSLKQADLGIAMQSGSQATRNAAEIVLLNDSFSALPAAFQEGQRIRRGLQGVLELFLTRVFTVTLVILAVLMVEAGFPFSPGTLTLLTMLTVGIPTFGIALWATPGMAPRRMSPAIVRFVLPASITLAIAAFLVYILIFQISNLSLTDLPDGGILERRGLSVTDTAAREGLIHTLVLGGLVLVAFAAPPTQWWAVVKRNTRDWRPTMLALLMVPVYVIILLRDDLRGFFDLHALRPQDYLIIAGIVGIWTLAVREVWKRNIFGRYFGYDRRRPDQPLPESQL